MYKAIIEFFNEFTSLSIICRMLVAVVIGGIIGLERGRRGMAAGFRTHVLVCLGSCVTALVGIYGTEILGFQGDPMRISAQVISGIGFLGVGSIFIVGQRYIRGLTTAAGLWGTAAVGLAAGIGAVEIAGLSSALIIIAMSVMRRIEQSLNIEGKYDHYYLELSDPKLVNAIIDTLEKKYSLSEASVIPARSNTPGYIGIQAICIRKVKNTTKGPDIKELLKEEGVIIAVRFV